MLSFFGDSSFSMIDQLTGQMTELSLVPLSISLPRPPITWVIVWQGQPPSGNDLGGHGVPVHANHQDPSEVTKPHLWLGKLDSEASSHRPGTKAWQIPCNIQFPFQPPLPFRSLCLFVPQGVTALVAPCIDAPMPWGLKGLKGLKASDLEIFLFTSSLLSHLAHSHLLQSTVVRTDCHQGWSSRSTGKLSFPGSFHLLCRHCRLFCLLC